MADALQDRLVSQLAALVGQLGDVKRAAVNLEFQEVDRVVNAGLKVCDELMQIVRNHVVFSAPVRLTDLEYEQCGRFFKDATNELFSIRVALQGRGETLVREAANCLRNDGESTITLTNLESAVRFADLLDKKSEEFARREFELDNLLGQRHHAPVSQASFPDYVVQELRQKATRRKGLLQNPMVAPYPGVFKKGTPRERNLDVSPLRRTGTRLIAERFLPDENVFECEQCGGGMTERVRKGGLNMLVCGYCGHERELSAPPRAPVAWHDFSAAKADASELLKRVEGMTSWECSECGAQVDSAADRMTGRCAYCGSHDFVRLDEDRAVLQPQGVQRFACDAARAEQLLRSWLKQRRDAPVGFHHDVQVEAVEARYLPYWILDVDILDRKTNLPVVSVQNVHACASRQLRQRMPSELRAIEPFETRMVPGFEPEQLAGTVCERFTVDLDEAWRNAQHRVKQALEREIKERRLDVSPADARVSFKYLLLPAYFFVLSYEGAEYHALMDGAGAGIGVDYPRSVSRVVMRQILWAALVTSVLVFVALISLVVYHTGDDRREAEAKAEAELQAELEERNAKARAHNERVEAKRREREEENRKKEAEAKAREEKNARLRALWEMPIEDRSWDSEPFEMSMPVTADINVDPEGTVTVGFKARLLFGTNDIRVLDYVARARDPDTSRKVQEAILAAMPGAMSYEIKGTVRMNHGASRELVRVLGELIAPGDDEFSDNVDRFFFVTTTENVEPQYSGVVRVEWDRYRNGEKHKCYVMLKMDPVNDPERFCWWIASDGLAGRCEDAVERHTDRNGMVDTEAAMAAIQKLLDGLITENYSYRDWQGTVTVTDIQN